MVGLLPIGALFGLLAFVANVEIRDLDLWLHIGVGKFIWQHHMVPSVDILSCSIAGKPWINHEWLFQIIVYNIYHYFGADGLLKMQIVIVCITMGILLVLGYSKDRQLFIAFMLFLVFLVFQERFTIRPDIFSLLFFALYIFILALHIDKKWAAPALVFIQMLWVNMHGFFFLGPLFILIGLVSEWLKRHAPLPWEWNSMGRLNDDEFKRLQIILGLVILGCLANPYFIEGAWYPLGVLFTLGGKNKIFFQFIQELQKPVTASTLWDTGYFVTYKILILLSFVSFIFNRRRIDISALFFWIIFLLFSLQAVRNGIFFAFAAYLVVMTNVLTIKTGDIIPLRFTEEKFKHLTAMVFKILFLVFLFQFGADAAARGYYDFDKFEQKSEYGGISRRTYPDKAVDFLIEHKIKGNVFNDFNSGAYLVGRTFPDIKVYIDGRTEVYGGDFFKDYQKVWAEGNGAIFEREVKAHDITIVFMNASRQYLPKPFVNYMYHHKEWALVYFDYDAMIFLKRGSVQQPLIDQYAIDLAKWQAKPLDLLKVGQSPLVPYQYFVRAYTLNQLDLLEPAFSEIKEAIEIMPNYGEAYHLIGQIYIKQKKFEDAYKNLRVAAIFFPDHLQIKLDLASSYMELGHYDKALEVTRSILARSPKDLGAQFLLAEIYARQGQFAPSLNVLRAAVSLKPKSPEDILIIGEVASKAGAFNEALEMYSLALQVDNQNFEAHKRMGKIYKDRGELDKAREHLEKALQIKQEDGEIKGLLKGL